MEEITNTQVYQTMLWVDHLKSLLNAGSRCTLDISYPKKFVKEKVDVRKESLVIQTIPNHFN
jgi:hypothetical protein